ALEGSSRTERGRGMIRRQAPHIASWLLRVFCSTPDYDPVIGDLIEQCQLGKRPRWYWRQVLAILFMRRSAMAGLRCMDSMELAPVLLILGVGACLLSV